MAGYPINIKNFCYTRLDKKTGTYEAPWKIPGLMEIKQDMSTETAKLSGDGMTTAISSKEGDVSLEAGLNKVPLADQARMLGRTFDANLGTLLKNDGDSAPYLAAGYEIENDNNTSAFVWLYKGKFEQHSESYKQIEDGKVTYSTPTIKGTFIADASGHKGIMMDENEGVNPPANFLDSVYFPSADTAAPTVTSVPSAAATAVLGTSNVVLTFSKAMLATTINAANIFIMKADGSSVPGTLAISAADTVVTFDPTSTLTAGDYIIIVTTNVRSAAGVALTDRYAANFTV